MKIHPSTFDILYKYRKRRTLVDFVDYNNLIALKSIGLIEIDKVYVSTYKGVTFRHANVTEKGELLLKKYMYYKYPLIRHILKYRKRYTATLLSIIINTIFILIFF